MSEAAEYEGPPGPCVYAWRLLSLASTLSAAIVMTMSHSHDVATGVDQANNKCFIVTPPAPVRVCPTCFSRFGSHDSGSSLQQCTSPQFGFPICGPNANYCHQIGVAIGLGSLGVVMYILIVACSLFCIIPRLHVTEHKLLLAQQNVQVIQPKVEVLQQKVDQQNVQDP